MTNNNLRFATKEDIDFFFPGKIPFSVKGWVFEKDNNKYAIGGIWIVSGKYTVFLRTKENFPKKSFWLASKKVIEEIAKLDIPVVAIQDEHLPSSERYLTRLGFQFYNIQDNHKVYKLCN